MCHKKRRRECRLPRMEAKKKEMKALDLRRTEILEQQKIELQFEMSKKQAAVR